jgi:phosphatidylglycerophosphatase A
MSSEAPAEEVPLNDGSHRVEKSSAGVRGRLLDGLAWLYATGFGVGQCPVAPGTAASLFGPMLIGAWQSLHRSTIEGAAVAVIAVLLGVAAAGREARRCGRTDPGQVVCDELAAFPIVFVGIDVVSTWHVAVLGFIWFRVFDIWKPWPIRQLERLPRGWGIMADDLMAGVFAAAALHATRWLLATWI